MLAKGRADGANQEGQRGEGRPREQGRKGKPMSTHTLRKHVTGRQRPPRRGQKGLQPGQRRWPEGQAKR
eukprot:15432652-Alexandrium_andersonii.AAC.1